MIEPVGIPRSEKPWGYELLIAKTDVYAGKILHINAGHALSLQYHEQKDETFHLFTGEAVLHYHNEAGELNLIELAAGDSYHIPPHSVHRLEALTDCDFFEVSTTQLDDVVRLEDQYGRAPSGE